MIDDAALDAFVAGAYLADAHADSLMWNRDLNRREERGHVDFPRLLEGRAKLQCFTLVTRGFPVVGGMRAFVGWQGWPRHARADEWSRAVWQIEQLERYCAASQGQVAVARTRGDLDANAAAGRISAVLGVEGAHALGGRPERVAELWARGVRFMSLTHLAGNACGGGSFPLGLRRGLTAHGLEVLEQMARVGMAVDVAHASPRLLAELLQRYRGPVFSSHTGIDSATRSWRNLGDEDAQEIARRGGVVCVIFATAFLGGARLEDLVRHLERALEVAGEDAVGLGSDYDGFIRLPKPMRDVRDVRLIARALLERGHAKEVVGKVLGGNLRRFLASVMPVGSG